MEESNDLSHRHSSEHIFCGFSRRSSHITNFENYYYGMDEGSDHTQYSEDDDEYDETNADDVDCESTFHYSARNQMGGRLCRRNVATRLDRGNDSDNNFRNSSRSKWKKYQYQAVPRAMPIQEEDEETAAGPSTTNPNDYNMDYSQHNPTTNTNINTKTNPNNTNINRNTSMDLVRANEKNKHVIIHVNEFEFCDEDDNIVDDDDDDEDNDNDETDDGDDDELSGDEEVYFDKKSITKNHSLLVAYDNNSASVSTV